MSPTSIILCMAACFVGLVAALIVVNRFGSMSTRKLVVIAMMVAVYVGGVMRFPFKLITTLLPSAILSGSCKSTSSCKVIVPP